MLTKFSLLAMLGLLLVGGCVVASVKALEPEAAALRTTDCGQFLAGPTTGWVRLEGCVLDFGAALLVDGAHRPERLDDRLEGLWHQLPVGEVQWAQVVVPVRAREQLARPARLAVVLTDADLLTWVNALEQTTGQGRAQLLRRRAVVDRLTVPGQLIGQVTSQVRVEAVQRQAASDASAGPFLLAPGSPPAVQVPGVALLLGALGWAVFLWVIARRGAPVSQPALGTPPIDVSGVKVELGELNSLRSNDRQAGDS